MRDNNVKLTRREFFDGAIKTTLAATAISALGAENVFAGEKTTTFKTAHGSLIVEHEPFKLRLTNAAGVNLVESFSGSQSANARFGIGKSGKFDRLARVVRASKKANGWRLECESVGKQAVTITLAEQSNSIKLEIATAAADAIAMAFAYAPDEHLSGMGQRLRTLDVRGVNINSVARVNDDGVVKSNEDEFSAPMPFFLSNRGYGAFVETEGIWNFDFGKNDANAVALLANGATMNLHLLTGATHKELIKKYTALTGRMAQTADWNFGLWKWRDVYQDEFEVYQDAQMMRSLDLPATGIIIDSPWSDKYIDFELNPKQFASGRGFLDNLHKMGYKTVFWLVPFVNPNASNYKFADERGYFVKDQGGKTLLVDWWNPTGSPELGQGAGRLGAMIDFTFDAATRWWQSEVGKIVDAGCDGWKLDDGEFLPLAARMHNGKSGANVKSSYTMLYHKAVFEVMERKKPNDFAVMPRAAAAGAQKYMTSFWAGDQNADFDPQLGLPSVIMGAQSIGLAGYSIWTSDTGGYRQSPKPAVFARWTQFSAFCPLMIVGGKSYREPWHFSDEIESIFRRYAQLHAAMLPYIKAHAAEASAQGTPIIRPMFLEFPDDAQSYRHEYQFMFGSELLVAPVYTDDNFRAVYLPKGKWLDFHTLELHDGAKLIEKYDAPLDRIPVFVRAENSALTKFFQPLLVEQAKGFAARCDYYLQIRGKFLRPQPFDRLKTQTAAFKTAMPDTSFAASDLTRLETALNDFKKFIQKEEIEGGMPYFTAKNLRERLDAIELSTKAVKAIELTADGRR